MSALAVVARSNAVARTELNDVALKLREICRTATLDLSYRIGELIIREIYDGRVELWGHQGTRRPSYRCLAARGDLPLSPSALCKSVAVYVLSERLGGRADWRHLGASHLQEVLRLEASEQDRLLRLAEAERWTVARIRSEVDVMKPSRRARKPGGGLRKSLGALSSCISKHHRTLIDADELAGLDPSTVDQLKDAVSFLKLHIGELEDALRRSREKDGAKAEDRASFIRFDMEAPQPGNPTNEWMQRAPNAR